MSDLKNSILSEAKTQFLKCSESINNNSVHFAVGYSKFLSSLIYHNLIPNDEGNHFLDILLSHIERDGVKEQYVDMLSSFVAGVGRDFTKKVPTSLWNRFDSIISQKLPSRLHFLLKDVEEIRNQWLYDIPINVHSTNVAQIDENLKKVRDSLMNYLEGDEAICDLEPNDFIVSVCKMLPDQTGSDSYVFVEFVCDVLESKKPIQDKINRTLSMFARSYRENSIESDSPKTWSVFDDMLYLMMLRDILQVNEVKSVMLQFPDNHSSDVNNGMKWFLYDHWDFTSPVHSKNFLSNEIADALAMPSTIEEHNNHRIYMSRLIAISIVRSVIAKVSVEENPLEAMKKYRGFLAQVMRKEKDVFDDEITQAIEIYEFGFGLMDVQKLVEDV
ncbi:MIF4G domain containing protein [Histomonas meleagridis]|uniref:MIF4G domain containing protein n=1 Tax=Histomonas meleagridis TaxID=135588 RepID=UPI00355A027F|nr:MIF4G domain containing protein [Histomonas meleagridis]KAH0804941.1 MIF4G domain containing protein [Histomonas meleagridis]